MTTLEFYKSELQELDAICKAADGLSPEDIGKYQELLYRLHVMDTFQIYLQAAPKTMVKERLGSHLQWIMGTMCSLCGEREYPPAKTNEVRGAALSSMKKVITDCQKQFKGYLPSAETQYALEIKNAVLGYLSAWLQYRDAMFSIGKPADKSQMAPAEKDAKIRQASSAASNESVYEQALSTLCPIKKHKGKTLGDLILEDPGAIEWLANKYAGDESIRNAAQCICEHALQTA